MKHTHLLVVQMGTPPAAVRDLAGDQSQWFLAALAGTGATVTVVRPFLGEALPAPETFDAAVISGSWSMVTDHEDWSEAVAHWIRQVMQAGRRLLGVCYGHQLMAYALGGQVDYHPNGRELGQKQITLTTAAADDALLRHCLPQFDAHLSHSQTVLTPPPGAQVLGSSAHDPHQILRYSPTALSFQFHPEFTPAVMGACISTRATQLQAEGVDAETLLAVLSDTPVARSLLLDFMLP